MSGRIVTTEKVASLKLVVAGAVTTVVAACGSGATLPPGPATSTASPQVASAMVVDLGSQPSGTATLSWNPLTENVSVRLQMAGFTPGSSHAMHILRGSCAASGAAVVTFPDVTVDDHGVIDTTVTNVKSPAAESHFNIQLASDAGGGDPGSAGSAPVACADISPGASTTVTMAPLPQPGQHPQGSATLTFNPAKKTLTVTVSARGLIAGSVHAAHIHAGSCGLQGPVQYPLSDLTASTTGSTKASTVIHDVEQAPPASGWYIDVHLGHNSQMEDDGKLGRAFQPILCGDVVE